VTGRTATPSSERDLSPDRFAIHRTDTPGATIAFVHEGEGGFPLLLVHGWPETKRIWWRNVSVLAPVHVGYHTGDGGDRSDEP
jgi:pimeloyl-ACP methyl ester carboxylesterase